MTQPTEPTLADILAVVQDIQTQLRGPGLAGWEQLGTNAAGQFLTVVDALANNLGNAAGSTGLYAGIAELVTVVKDAQTVLSDLLTTAKDAQTLLTALQALLVLIPKV